MIGQLETYLDHLYAKGFKLSESDIKFIYFGKQITAASDYTIRLAIEYTLKLTFSFDGSFFVNLLEHLHEQQITKRHEVEAYLKVKNMIE